MLLFALLVGPAVGYGLRLANAVGGVGDDVMDDDSHPELEA